MTEVPAARRDETLLEHREWVRALALSLTRDAADADDVEQQTWLAALDRDPGGEDVRSWRAWFATVARNAARKTHRGESRRRVRESAAVGASPEPPPSELAERAEMHRCVVTAVLALPEPYRETILLRWFEGLSVAETAARSGVPLETARARLRRGKELLRTRLAEELGVDRDWRLAVALLAEPVARVPAPLVGTGAAVGGAVMGAKVVGVVVVSLLVAAVAWSSIGGPAPTPPTVSRPIAADAATVAEAPSVPGRARVETPPGGPAERPVAAEVRAKPVEKRPLKERLESKLRFALADLPVQEALGQLAEDADLPIFLAREVISQDGGGMLSFDDPVPAERILTLVTTLSGLTWVVDEDRIVVTPADGVWDHARELIEAPRPVRIPIVVRGRVVDDQGAPVEGAQVLHGADVVASTDVAGGFEASLRRPFSSLVARKAGRVDSERAGVQREAPETDRYELTLGGAAGDLLVRVESGGVALSDASVKSVNVAITRVAGATQAVPTDRSAPFEGAGNAVLKDIAPGKHVVEIGARGHVPATREVEVVAGRQTDIVVVLEKLAPLAQRLREKRVAANFKDFDATQAVNYFAHATGMNIVVDDSLYERAANTKLNLTLADQPLQDALTAICQILDAEVVLEGEIVMLRARAAK